MKASPELTSRELNGSILWITDPWNTLVFENETTIRLAQECLKQGKRTFWCNARTVHLASDGRVYLEAQEFLKIGEARAESSIELSPARKTLANAFPHQVYRCDPPVDESFRIPLQLLALARKQGPEFEMINPSEVILIASEKTEGALAPDLLAPSLVSCDLSLLETFGKSEGRVVLKPLDLAQSKGVELLDWSDPEGVQSAHEKVRAATHEFTVPVMLQRYFPSITQGETRLWFMDGRLLGAVRKIPKEGEFRVLIDAGASVGPAFLSERDEAAIEKISQVLIDRKIRMAAVDLIEGYVTDFNVTSPGLIVEMEQVLGENLSEKIVGAL